MPPKSRNMVATISTTSYHPSIIADLLGFGAPRPRSFGAGTPLGRCEIRHKLPWLGQSFSRYRSISFLTHTIYGACANPLRFLSTSRTKWALHILAPLLSSVRLKLKTMRGVRLIDARSPLFQLTDLRLYVPIEALELFELLRTPRNLVSLEVCLDYVHKLNLVHTTIRLPLLDRLGIDDFDCDEGARFLHYLDLPSLTTFHCRTSVARKWPFTALATLVSRSRCSIQTFVINLAMKLEMLWHGVMISLSALRNFPI